MSKKPTIAELEKLLNDPEEHPIEVLADGSIKVDRRRKGKGFISDINWMLKAHKLSSSY